MQTLPPLRPLTERSFLTTSNPGKYISLSLTELSIFVSLIASTSILESITKKLRASQCAGKPLIFNAAITKPRPNGLIVEGLPLLLVYLRLICGGKTHPFPSRQYPYHLLKCHCHEILRIHCFFFFPLSESLSGTYSPVRAVLSNKRGKMDFFTVFPKTFLAAIIKSCSCNPIRPCCFVTSFT